MRSLCLLLLVALACAFSVQDHNRHIASTMRGLKNYFTRPQTTTSSGLQLQGVTECQAAVQAVQDQILLCEVFTIFNDSYAYTYADLNTLIGTHCDTAATSCSKMLESALVNVLEQCVPVIGDDPNLWIGIGALLVANQVPCVQAAEMPGKWCFAEFKQFADRLSMAETNPLTDVDLAAGCTNCTAKVLLIWIAFEPSFEAIFTTTNVDIICSRDGTTWCFLEFQNTIDILGHTTDAEKITRAGEYCKPCTFIYLFKWKSLIEYANNHLNHALDEDLRNATNVVLYLGWLCVKDHSGVYCNAKVSQYNFTEVGLACAGSATAGPNGGPGCSANCRTQIRATISSLGCCLDTWLDLLAWGCFNDPQSCSADPSSNPVNIRAMITVLCGLSLPEGCQRRRVLEALVQVENLGWLWCQAHMPECLQLVRIAIAQQFFLDVADLREKILAEHLSGATPIAPPSRRLLQADMDVKVNVVGVSNSVGSVDASKRADTVVVSGTPGAAKTHIDKKTQTHVLSATVGTNSAAGVVPSISLALLAFLLLFV